MCGPFTLGKESDTPALLGRGKSALQGGTIETMEDILRCELLDVARSGPDIRLIARPRR
ncbi:hypothetical protein SAZ11_27740 [Streptomyces sp. FXJ1.4098]|nr:hypothetical protein [Streptomyces sp. FXJ1.4098]